MSRRWTPGTPWDPHRYPPPLARIEQPAAAVLGGTPASYGTAVTGFAESAYVRKALDEEAAAVASAVEGTRNDMLNRAAYSLGQLVAGGVLAEAVVWDVLRDAARRCRLGGSCRSC